MNTFLEWFARIVLILLVSIPISASVVATAALVYVLVQMPSDKRAIKGAIAVIVSSVVLLAILYVKSEPFVYAGMVAVALGIVWVVVKTWFVLRSKSDLWTIKRIKNWVDSFTKE